MDARTIATSLALVAAVAAGAALGWIHGSSPAQVMSSQVTTAAPGATTVAMAALEPAGSGAGDAYASTAPPTYAPYDAEVFAIGDSVLAGAAACLEARGIKVSAEQSRQVSAALEILGKRAGSLPPRVIVHLGTNGGATPAELDAIAALAVRYPNVRVFDWESMTRQQPEWLYVEGIHMTPQGCEGYAGLVEPQVRAPGPHGNA